MATKKELSAENVRLRELVEGAIRRLEVLAESLDWLAKQSGGDTGRVEVLAGQAHSYIGVLSAELREDVPDKGQLADLVRASGRWVTRAVETLALSALGAKYGPEAIDQAAQVIDHASQTFRALDSVSGFLGENLPPPDPAWTNGPSEVARRLQELRQSAGSGRVDVDIFPETPTATADVPTPTIRGDASARDVGTAQERDQALPVTPQRGSVSETSSDTAEITGEAVVEGRTAVSETRSGTASIQSGSDIAEGQATFTPPVDPDSESESGATSTEKLETEINVTTSITDTLRSPDPERDETREDRKSTSPSGSRIGLEQGGALLLEDGNTGTAQANFGGWEARVGGTEPQGDVVGDGGDDINLTEAQKSNEDLP